MRARKPICCDPFKGGAGPVTGLLAADRMIRHQGCDLVAVVAGDAVSSLDTDDFLKRADAGCVPENQPLFYSIVNLDRPCAQLSGP